MPEKKKTTSSGATASGRSLTITLEPLAGTFTYFIAYVGSTRRIFSDGSEKVSWTGDITTAQVTISIRIVGIGTPKFKFGIDLPGTADDQSLTLSLTQGYYEADFTV
jgi:hypothetical protein